MKKLLVLALAIFVAGCNTKSPQFSSTDPRRGTVAQPADLRAMGDHVMIRIIKERQVLELWKLGPSGWQKARSYFICMYSGTLGPKKKEGDNQAPEGFYTVTRGSLNPNSIEHLSFNLGYPNVRDRASGYTGSYLMVHGGCSSRGCYAITDQSMEEVYSAVRDALNRGQQSVQVQIYPFIMTDRRMEQEKQNPNHAFWTELKAGWDQFERNPRPLNVTVQRGRYVVN